MNNEIKEILKILKKCEFGACITKHNSRVLLDYITNLQEENERLIKNQRYYKNGVFSLEYDKETLSDMIDDYKSKIDKARHKLNIMFSNGNEDIILDDLLELDKILGESNE